MWQWLIEGHPPYASLRFEADLRDHDRATLLLRHTTASGRWIEYWIWLYVTVPNYGGHRWWFKCQS